jgi:hypothetical protein
MRVESAATSVSWIPSEAVTGVMRSSFSTGLVHYDDPPPATLGDLDELRSADGFRFANRLQAWADFDGAVVADCGQDGGGIMGSTTVRIGRLGATFAAVGLPDLRPEPVRGSGWVRFTQTVGGRTALPLPWPLPRPPFFRFHAPFVWTTLSLTLHADGHAEITMPGASPFPRHWVYGASGQLELKAGVADWETWLGQPSWRATPWGDQDSPALVTAAETALERELSSLLMHGDTPPRTRSLPEGAVLTRQGELGTSLFLLLDGVVSVSVDGAAVGELGPGAIVGERAILGGGRRSATLTAATRVRVAEATADVVEIAALERLAEGHHREDAQRSEPTR